jgi:hypothetical protein
MCLTISGFATRELAREAKKKPKIATKDIVVYKRLMKYSNISPHYYMFWKKGYRYDEDSFGFSQIEKSYFYGDWRFEISKGLHCYSSKKVAIANLFLDEKLIEMIIPKGTEYFENEKNCEIVTKTLIWY